MKQSEYSKIITLAKRTIEEHKNWDEEEISTDKENKDFSGQEMKKVKNIPKQNKNASELLEDLQKKVCNCKKCPLGNYRLNAVFGVGNPYSDILFIGEGPGFQEDHQGEPFIGRAGNLLDKIIEAMGFTRQSVYIANIVKCHPMKDPTNPELRANDRPPTPEEMAICKPYLDKQIELISPKVIITLGASSSRALIQTDEVISSLRGNFKEYMGIKVMPTYHPAALLRNPNLKKDVWSDMKKVLSILKKG
ncbi:MAG: uracil-DNA glycosylase [Endomicrobiaceae bacterium]|nr:uracil-DNA glycosylase [Endomicrobiaceae bacterium]